MNDPKTEEWVKSIHNITALYEKEFASLTEEQLNTKPNPKAWSIGQVMDHVIKTNETYWPVITKIRLGLYELPWTGKLKFLVKLFGNLILKSVEPKRSKKIKTLPIWEPSQSNIPADILSRFITHQQALEKLIRDSEDLVQLNIVISSPANEKLVYTLPVAFDIIIAHELRHFYQAKEVKDMLK